MTLVRTNRNFYPSFNSLFNDFFGDQLSSHAGVQQVTNPLVNVVESESGYTLEIAAPGFEKQDFSIEVNENVLSISIAKKEESEENEAKYTRREFFYSNFEKRFTLPKGLIDESKIEAKYENGILYVAVPKSEEVKPKPARKIELL